MQGYVNLLHEMNMLSFIPRSGFAFLGSGKQSVAEHSYGATLIAYILASLSTQPVDLKKLLLLCLLHDLPEARIGDLNYVQKKYLKPNLEKALNDLAHGSPIGPQLVDLILEYEEGKTLEAQLAHDADQLELLVNLKKIQEMGNPRAEKWYINACKRIKTSVGQQLAQAIWEQPSDVWWMQNKDDPHWVDGGKSLAH